MGLFSKLVGNEKSQFISTVNENYFFDLLDRVVAWKNNEKYCGGLEILDVYVQYIREGGTFKFFIFAPTFEDKDHFNRICRSSNPKDMEFIKDFDDWMFSFSSPFEGMAEGIVSPYFGTATNAKSSDVDNIVRNLKLKANKRYKNFNFK